MVATKRAVACQEVRRQPRRGGNIIRKRQFGSRLVRHLVRAL